MLDLGLYFQTPSELLFESLNDPFYLEYPSLRYINETENEKINLKEIKSENENFMKEKNIKFNLYPLYINWKKIEKEKTSKNIHYNIFKLFGYFGIAMFNILIEINNNEDYCNHKNFLSKLISYKKNYIIKEIKENKFMEKLISVYDDVISLIKNKIIIFKEINVILIIMRLYETYFLTIKDKIKLLEVLKYEYLIISKMKDDEYKKIYDKYYKKLGNNYDYDDSLDYYEDNDSFIYRSNNSFPKRKKSYINYIRSIYKKINKITQIKIKEEEQ